MQSRCPCITGLPACNRSSVVTRVLKQLWHGCLLGQVFQQGTANFKSLCVIAITFSHSSMCRARIVLIFVDEINRFIECGATWLEVTIYLHLILWTSSTFDSTSGNATLKEKKTVSQTSGTEFQSNYSQYTNLHTYCYTSASAVTQRLIIDPAAEFWHIHVLDSTQKTFSNFLFRTNTVQKLPITLPQV